MVLYTMLRAIGSAGQERHVDIVEIVGSNPTSPTIKASTKCRCFLIYTIYIRKFNIYPIYSHIGINIDLLIILFFNIYW